MLSIGTNGFMTLHAQSPVVTHRTESEVITQGKSIGFRLLARDCCQMCCKGHSGDLVLTLLP